MASHEPGQVAALADDHRDAERHGLEELVRQAVAVRQHRDIEAAPEVRRVALALTGQHRLVAGQFAEACHPECGGHPWCVGADQQHLAATGPCQLHHPVELPALAGRADVHHQACAVGTHDDVVIGKEVVRPDGIVRRAVEAPVQAPHRLVDDHAVAGTRDDPALPHELHQHPHGAGAPGPVRHDLVRVVGVGHAVAQPGKEGHDAAALVVRVDAPGSTQLAPVAPEEADRPGLLPHPAAQAVERRTDAAAHRPHQRRDGGAIPQAVPGQRQRHPQRNEPTPGARVVGIDPHQFGLALRAPGVEHAQIELGVGIGEHQHAAGATGPRWNFAMATRSWPVRQRRAVRRWQRRAAFSARPEPARPAPAQPRDGAPA